MILAFVDLRPCLYLGGVPVALLIAWIVAHSTGRRFASSAVVVSTLALYTSLFLFVFAGPFVGRESNETFKMTWTVAETPSQGQDEAEVILTFVKHPDCSVGEFSDELAAYLRKKDESVVTATFGVTRDFGSVRGFHLVKVGDLTGWKSEYGYFSSIGSDNDSPW